MLLRPRAFTRNILAFSLPVLSLLSTSYPLFAETASADSGARPENYKPPTLQVSKTSRLAFHPSLGGQQVIALGNRASSPQAPLVVGGQLVAFNQQVNVAEGSAKTVSLFGGSTTGSKTSFEIVGKPANGSLQAINAAGGLVTYVPKPGFVGTDSFTFRIRDGLNNSNVGTVSLRVGVGGKTNQPTVALAGDRSIDSFTQELEKEGVEFTQEQAKRQRDFFEDLRSKNLSSDETASRARDFQKEQAERQRKFSEDRAEKIRKNEEDKVTSGDRSPAFENRDFGFVLKRSQFVLNQLEERNAFIEKLNNRGLSDEERIAELNEFFAKQRQAAAEFLQDFDDNI